MDHHGKHHHHHNLVFDELACHLPHAIFAVSFALSIVSFMNFGSSSCDTADILFHSFHFMHILFATTGTMITFLRFSNKWWRALIISIISPVFFCILSDMLLPYLGGRLLGVPMKWHICFVSEFKNVLPFMIIGLVNGFLMSQHHAGAQSFYVRCAHVIHILVSSLASTFYLVSHGFEHWYDHIGIVFLFLVIAVVLPCTLSDVVVPIAFAKAGERNEKHSV